MSKQLFAAWGYVCIALSASALVVAQTPEAKALFDKAEALKQDYAQAAPLFRQAIEADPTFFDAHERFILATRRAAAPTMTTPEGKAAFERATADLKSIYAGWAKTYPKVAGIEYELGALESDWLVAEPHYQRAIAIDPTFARAYLQLSLIADFRGENQKQVDLLKKASEVDPKDPQYFFYYSSAMKRLDAAKSIALMQEVADRYPGTERGAQGLYWAAFETREMPKKIAIYERLKRDFPPEKTSWSSSGMPEFFQVLVRVDVEKAIALAADMTARMPGKSDVKSWQDYGDYARALKEARTQIEARRLSDAIALIEKTVRPPRFDSTPLDILKAEARDGSGETSKAYEELVALAAKTPSDALTGGVAKYGTKLGKTPAAVDADIWAQRDAAAKPAPAFSLPDYPDGTPISLDAHRGKVVLVNFWYPSCGPCRGEFPTLQRVFAKYKDRGFVLLAINVLPEEDALVMPYLRNNGFTFRSLKSTTDWAEKTYGVRGYPGNFLVDAEGRTIFKPGVVQGADAERLLELQVEALLAHKTRR